VRNRRSSTEQPATIRTRAATVQATTPPDGPAAGPLSTPVPRHRRGTSLPRRSRPLRTLLPGNRFDREGRRRFRPDRSERRSPSPDRRSARNRRRRRRRSGGSSVPGRNRPPEGTLHRWRCPERNIRSGRRSLRPRYRRTSRRRKGEGCKRRPDRSTFRLRIRMLPASRAARARRAPEFRTAWRRGEGGWTGPAAKVSAPPRCRQHRRK